MKVRFTPSARACFLEALEYGARDKPTAAKRLRTRAEAALRRLERFPSSGRRIPEFPGLPQREIVLDPLRFFYRVEKSSIWIVAVWHTRQVPLKP